jgi:hypothetical protein
MSAAFSAEDYKGLEMLIQKAREIEAYSPDYGQAAANAARQAAAPLSNTQQAPGPAPSVQSTSGQQNTRLVQQGDAMGYNVEPSIGKSASEVQEGQTSALSEQLASGVSNTRLFQQGQALGYGLQLSSGNPNDRPFHLAQPLGFPRITPLPQAHHNDFPRSVGRSVLPGIPGVPGIPAASQSRSGNVPTPAEDSKRLQESSFKVGSKALKYIDLTEESDEEKVLPDVAKIPEARNLVDLTDD